MAWPQDVSAAQRAGYRGQGAVDRLRLRYECYVALDRAGRLTGP